MRTVILVSVIYFCDRAYPMNPADETTIEFLAYLIMVSAVMDVLELKLFKSKR